MEYEKDTEISEKSTWEIPLGHRMSKLEGSIEADVVIIGAGITGIFNAYVLSKAGLQVVVLEKSRHILSHETLYTTAFITQLIDTSFSELVSMFGMDKAKLVWQSGRHAIQMISDLVKSENIDCEFKSVGAITYANNPKEFEKLKKEYESIKKAGFEGSLHNDGSTLGFSNGGFMEVPNQAMFHPIKFCLALALLAESAGAKIFTDSKVLEIQGLTAKTSEGEVQARDIVIATHAPFIKEGTRFKKAPYESYVYELEIPRGTIPEGLYLDMHNPYHYFRIDDFKDSDPIRDKNTLRALAISNGTSRMIVGGEDHREDIKINPDKNFTALSGYVEALLPKRDFKIKRKWKGDILESIDGLPLIGLVRPHTFVATAFSGNGMTYSALSAVIICDLIKPPRVPNPYIGLYNPRRIPSLRQLFTKGLHYGSLFWGGAVHNFFSSKY